MRTRQESLTTSTRQAEACRSLKAMSAVNETKVNEIGRQRAQSGLYSNSREACNSFRVKDINEKY